MKTVFNLVKGNMPEIDSKRYTKEQLRKLNNRYESEHWLTDDDVLMANCYVGLIEATRNSKKPQVGDSVIYTNEYGDYYAKAYIDSVDEENGEVYICEIPYVPFIGAKADGTGIASSCSGGAWHWTSTSEMKYSKLVSRKFCDWGSCGGCKDGAVEFEANVCEWIYTDSRNPFSVDDEKLTTENYNRMFVSMFPDNRSGYLFHGDGIAWRTSEEFNEWLKVNRAVKFDWGTNKWCVWYWKTVEHNRITPEEYDELNATEKVKMFNGARRRYKIMYDEEAKLIHTYMVWYWDIPGVDFYDALGKCNEIRKRYEVS